VLRRFSNSDSLYLLLATSPTIWRDESHPGGYHDRASTGWQTMTLQGTPTSVRREAAHFTAGLLRIICTVNVPVLPS
jgi:hypothetical protein